MCVCYHCLVSHLLCVLPLSAVHSEMILFASDCYFPPCVVVISPHEARTQTVFIGGSTNNVHSLNFLYCLYIAATCSYLLSQSCCPNRKTIIACLYTPPSLVVHHSLLQRKLPVIFQMMPSLRLTWCKHIFVLPPLTLQPMIIALSGCASSWKGFD